MPCSVSSSARMVAMTLLRSASGSMTRWDRRGPSTAMTALWTRFLTSPKLAEPSTAAAVGSRPSRSLSSMSGRLGRHGLCRARPQQLPHTAQRGRSGVVLAGDVHLGERAEGLRRIGAGIAGDDGASLVGRAGDVAMARDEDVGIPAEQRLDVGRFHPDLAVRTVEHELKGFVGVAHEAE